MDQEAVGILPLTVISLSLFSFCFLTDIYHHKIFYLNSYINVSLYTFFFSLTVGPIWVQRLLIYNFFNSSSTYSELEQWICSQYLMKREVKWLVPQITELFTSRFRDKLASVLYCIVLYYIILYYCITLPTLASFPSRSCHRAHDEQKVSSGFLCFATSPLVLWKDHSPKSWEGWKTREQEWVSGKVCPEAGLDWIDLSASSFVNLI